VRRGGTAWWGLCLTVCAASPARAAEPDEFEVRLAQVRTALATRATDDARRACRQARRAAGEPKFGGPRTARAFEACGRVELAADRPRAAARAYARAARAAVSEPKLRRKYLSKRRQAAFRAKARRAAADVTDLLALDAKVQAVLRKPRRRGKAAERAAEQMLEAQRAYRSDGDAEQARLASAARALVLAYTDRRALADKLATRVLARPAPPNVEQAAWRALFQARLSAQDLVGAARAAIHVDALRHRDAAEAVRRLSRGPELGQACRALDGQDGPGRCTRLQIAERGFAALVDHSRRRVPALAEAQLARVHEDALPALEVCVLTLAKADPERYRGEELRFSWTIGPDGKPLNVEVRPRRHVEGAAPCLEAIRWFRYPRTPATAERRNVSIPYRLD